jgi:hypothetical protein
LKLGLICSADLAELWLAAIEAAAPRTEVLLSLDERASAKQMRGVVSNEKLLRDSDLIWVPAAASDSLLEFSRQTVANSVLCGAANASILSSTGSGYIIPSFPLRHRAEIRHLKEMVGLGKLGQIGMARVSLCRSNNGTGELCYEELTPGLNALGQLGIHGFDIIRFCFGKIDGVHAVQSSESAASSKYALIVLRLENGAVAHLECSIAEVPGTAYIGYEIAGADGMLEYDSRKEPTFAIHSMKASSQPAPPPAELISELRAFMHREHSALATSADAAAAWKITVQAMQSAREFAS